MGGHLAGWGLMTAGSVGVCRELVCVCVCVGELVGIECVRRWLNWEWGYGN